MVGRIKTTIIFQGDTPSHKTGAIRGGLRRGEGYLQKRGPTPRYCGCCLYDGPFFYDREIVRRKQMRESQRSLIDDAVMVAKTQWGII